MKHLFPLFVFFLSFKVFSYEWYQVEDSGLIYKKISLKDPTKNESFTDLNFESKKITFEDTKIKFPQLTHPKKIILIGDTGCRIAEKNGKTEYQDCNNSLTWPFQNIVKHVQEERGDLIIHLGDYHYREVCSPLNDCQKMTSVVGYGWRPWELDFFLPMENLLKEVPILIARGNHEDCKRAFLGYGKFLYNQNWGGGCVEYEEAQIIQLGDIAVINLDTSSMDDRPTSEKGEETKWVSRFNEIAQKLTHMKYHQVWLVTHKPAYGLAPFMKAFAPVNINFRNYIEKSNLSKKVSFIFSGHIHTSMLVKTQNQPTQIVLGNSGTKLEHYDSEIRPAFLKLFNYTSAEIINNGFGYAVLVENTSHTWVIEFKNANGVTLKRIIL